MNIVSFDDSDASWIICQEPEFTLNEIYMGTHLNQVNVGA